MCGGVQAAGRRQHLCRAARVRPPHRPRSLLSLLTMDSHSASDPALSSTTVLPSCVRRRIISPERCDTKTEGMKGSGWRGSCVGGNGTAVVRLLHGWLHFEGRTRAGVPGMQPPPSLFRPLCNPFSPSSPCEGLEPHQPSPHLCHEDERLVSIIVNDGSRRARRLCMCNLQHSIAGQSAWTSAPLGAHQPPPLGRATACHCAAAHPQWSPPSLPGSPQYT